MRGRSGVKSGTEGEGRVVKTVGLDKISRNTKDK